jgi:hypothetical protein
MTIEDSTSTRDTAERCGEKAILRMKMAAYSVGKLLDDISPVPTDLIGPRVLTPRGFLVLGNTSQTGKGDFLLPLCAHLAAGQPFVGLIPPRPLRIFYLQTESGYHYLRERVRNMVIAPHLLPLVNHNLAITAKSPLLLNKAGVSLTLQTIQEHFKEVPVDLIVVDSLWRVIDSTEQKAGQSEEEWIDFFLEKRLKALRDAVNPEAGILLWDQAEKLSRRSLEWDLFQAFQGAYSLQTHCSAGMVLREVDYHPALRELIFNLKNGGSLKTKILHIRGGVWQEIQ